MGKEKLTKVDYETNAVIIGLKGTSEKSLAQDVVDDVIIMSAPNYCDLSLVEEGDRVLQETLFRMQDNTDELVTGRATSTDPPTITFVGHSLGGTAAMCKEP